MSGYHQPAKIDQLTQVSSIRDWRLYAHPEPSLSYRTLVVCRLLHVRSPEAILADTQSTSWEPDIITGYEYNEDSYERWKACVLGYVDYVSSRNEDEVRTTLSTLCNKILTEANDGIRRVETYVSGRSDVANVTASWLPFATQCIKHLWQEQADVALAVRIHIQSGAEL